MSLRCARREVVLRVRLVPNVCEAVRGGGGLRRTRSSPNGGAPLVPKIVSGRGPLGGVPANVWCIGRCAQGCLGRCPGRRPWSRWCPDAASPGGVTAGVLAVAPLVPAFVRVCVCVHVLQRSGGRVLHDGLMYFCAWVRE